MKKALGYFAFFVGFIWTIIVFIGSVSSDQFLTSAESWYFPWVRNFVEDYGLYTIALLVISIAITFFVMRHKNRPVEEKVEEISPYIALLTASRFYQDKVKNTPFARAMRRDANFLEDRMTMDNWYAHYLIGQLYLPLYGVERLGQETVLIPHRRT